MIHTIALAFFQVVFGAGVTIGPGASFGTPVIGAGALRMPADCSVLTPTAWTALELQYPPMEIEPAATQEGDGCAPWALPSSYLSSGRSLP
jgi:hypothetical protein